MKLPMVIELSSNCFWYDKDTRVLRFKDNWKVSAPANAPKLIDSLGNRRTVAEHLSIIDAIEIMGMRERIMFTPTKELSAIRGPIYDVSFTGSDKNGNEYILKASIVAPGVTGHNYWRFA